MAKETKKDVADYSVEEKLQLLYKLQTVLSQIDQIKTLRGELPLEVQDLEDEVAGLNTRIDKIHADIDDCGLAVKDFTHRKSVAMASIEKFKADLDNIRNNREYDALNKEIEYQCLEVELCDKRIGEFTMRQNDKKQELEQTIALLQETKQELELKKTELDEIIDENRLEEEKLREKAKTLEVNIEPRLLLSFKRIRKNSRNGLGVVYVQRDACGGCFNRIPPQRQLDIRMRKKIIVCEYCGRILIDPELAGVETAPQQNADAAPKKRAQRKSTAAEKE